MKLTKSTLIENKLFGKDTIMEIFVPSTFSLDPAKMRNNPMTKEQKAYFKKLGINHPEYKEWIFNNWAYDKYKEMYNVIDLTKPALIETKVFPIGTKVLIEKKDHLIKKMTQLTNDQQEELIDYFNKHPNLENKLDWNKARSYTWNEIVNAVNLYDDSKTAKRKKVKAQGISGLKEGKDYIDYSHLVPEGIGAYVPLTHEASKLIGSAKIGVCEASWCTAMNSDQYWKDYTEEGVKFLYLVDYNDEDTDGYTKIGLAVISEDDLEAYDQNDDMIPIRTNVKMRSGEVDLRKLGREVYNDDRIQLVAPMTNEDTMEYILDYIHDYDIIPIGETKYFKNPRGFKTEHYGVKFYGDEPVSKLVGNLFESCDIGAWSDNDYWSVFEKIVDRFPKTDEYLEKAFNYVTGETLTIDEWLQMTGDEVNRLNRDLMKKLRELEPDFDYSYFTDKVSTYVLSNFKDGYSVAIYGRDDYQSISVSLHTRNLIKLLKDISLYENGQLISERFADKILQDYTLPKKKYTVSDLFDIIKEQDGERYLSTLRRFLMEMMSDRELDIVKIKDL